MVYNLIGDGSSGGTTAGAARAALRAACEGMSAYDWSDLVAGCVRRAAAEMVRTKGLALRRASSAVERNVRRYAGEGAARAGRDDLEALRRTAVDLPASARRALEEFRALPRGEQTDQIIDILVAWAMFWATAGGRDMEGGLPDSDLALGIGAHRNLFSHTILIGLAAELSFRTALELLEALIRRMPADRHPLWQEVDRAARRHSGAAFSGLWAGLGAHLLKDAGLFAARTKPYSGLRIRMPMWGHQGMLFANGATSEVFALSHEGEHSGPRACRQA